MWSLVRQEDHRLNTAAAFDAEWVRQHGSPEQAVRAHLECAGMPRLPEGIHRGLEGHAATHATALVTRGGAPLSGGRRGWLR